MVRLNPRSGDERDEPSRAGRAGGGLLIWLSGADPQALARAPRERRKFIGVGGAVLTTAVMATLSAVFALHVALRAPLVASIALGLLWGLAIMNLDRWLVTAAQRRETWRQNLVVALPRLGLALIIGTVISTPLVLWIFQSEINTELDVIHQQKLAQHQEVLAKDTRFTDIPRLQAEVANLQKIVDGTAVDNRADQDPDVVRLQAQYDKLDRQYQDAQKLATCELDGTCGTKVRGAAGAYRQKQQVADEYKRQRDAVKRQLDAARQQAVAQQQSTAGKERQSATAQLARDRADLDRMTRTKQLEEAQFAASVSNDRGLLARMDALSRLTGHNATLQLAYLFLMLFITAIEVLPVLVKFLMNLGPPSPYDEILARAERTDVEAADASFAYERELAVREFETRARREQEVLDHMVDRSVAAQADLYNRAVDHWHREQLRRFNDDPDSVLRQMGGRSKRLRLPRRRRFAFPWRRASIESGYAPWPQDEGRSYQDGGHAAGAATWQAQPADSRDGTTARWTYEL